MTERLFLRTVSEPRWEVTRVEDTGVLGHRSVSEQSGTSTRTRSRGARRRFTHG